MPPALTVRYGVWHTRQEGFTLLKRQSWIVLMVLALVVALSGAGLAGEAPMLRERVESGELPPLDERLPVEPYVVETVEQIGEYGGTLYMVAQSLAGFGTDMHVLGIEPPLRLSSDGVTVLPNILRDWETEDFQTWTLHFREGMRWSDGHPFTAEDMMFWWEDEVNNPLITAAIYIREFQNAQLEMIDPYTVVMTLDRPFPMFEYTLVTQWGYLGQWWRPKHHLSQFNPNYVPEEELLALAEEEGYETIQQLWRAKAGWSAKPFDAGLPVINAHKLVEKRLDTWVWERNPYYWKVDTAGNQLPYIDGAIVQHIADAETITAQVVSGQVDIEVWHTSLDNFSLYRANEESGNYRTLMWSSDKGAEVMLMPVHTYQDEELAEVFQDVRFRKALSLAIDRDEINEMLYFGLATPRQFTLHPSSEFYNPEWAEVYVDYDPEAANDLLDDMGLTQRDSAGYRLLPSGRRLAFTAEYWPSEPETKTPMMELMVDYWGELGIDLALTPQDRSLNAQRAGANEIALNLWHGGHVIDIEWQINMQPPLPSSGISWGPGYNAWYEDTGSENAVEPPALVKELYDLADELRVETDPGRRMELGQAMWQMQADNLFYIGTVGMAPYPIIVSNDLRNVPEEALWSALWLHRYHPEQFFLTR